MEIRISLTIALLISSTLASEDIRQCSNKFCILEDYDKLELPSTEAGSTVQVTVTPHILEIFEVSQSQLLTGILTSHYSPRSVTLSPASPSPCTWGSSGKTQGSSTRRTPWRTCRAWASPSSITSGTRT